MRDILDRMFLHAPEGKEGGGAGDADQEAETNETQAPEADPKQEDQAPEHVPYDRFKEVNDRLKEATSTLKKITKENEQKEIQTKEEQGKFEDLYKTEAQKREQAELELMKMRVGISKGLPLPLIARLQGATEEELTEDAEQLISLVPEGDRRENTPPNNPRRKTSSRLDISQMSAEEIRKNSAELVKQLQG